MKNESTIELLLRQLAAAEEADAMRKAQLIAAYEEEGRLRWRIVELENELSSLRGRTTLAAVMEILDGERNTVAWCDNCAEQTARADELAAELAEVRRTVG